MFVVMEDGGKKRLAFTSHTSHSSHAHGDHGHSHQEEHLDAHRGSHIDVQQILNECWLILLMGS
jgi:hypothetical protein